MKYQRIPTKVEIIQWLGKPNDENVLKFCKYAKFSHFNDNGNCRLNISSDNGHHWVYPGEFIIKETEDKFDTCEPQIFGKLYERVN